MPRRLANGLTLLSAVVWVGSAMVVGRSWRWMDHAGVSLGEGRLWLVAIDAQFLIIWDPHAASPGAGLSPSFETADASRLRPALDTVWGNMRGLRPLLGWNMTGRHDERAIVSLWLLPLLTAIAPVRWWRRRRRETRGFPVAPAKQAGPQGDPGDRRRQSKRRDAAGITAALHDHAEPATR